MSLLNDASLVLIPSGYKEDKVYSIIPSDGSGDLDFVRGSDGTRINSLGQVENVCWNLALKSEAFNDTDWLKYQASVNANVATAPNGTNTADFLYDNPANDAHIAFQNLYLQKGVYTISVYAKANTLSHINLQFYDGTAGYQSNAFDLANGTTTGANQSIESVGNGWYRCSYFYNLPTSANTLCYVFLNNGSSPVYSGTGKGVYVWGGQVNAGALKPYFPTTDRLNVPRLTYENGCPSLLLEKQSSNSLLYSEDFTNGTWANAGGTVTGNATISPDGTQNADTLTGARYQGGGSSNTWTFSCYAKKVNGDNKFLLRLDVPTLKYAQFDLNTGIIDDVSSGYSATIKDAGNGWYRCTLTTPPSTSISNIVLVSANGGANSTYVWGAQIEASSYPTSYIPTTSTSVTRLADSCYKTGISSLIGQTSGAMFCEFNYYDNISGSMELVPMYIGAGAYSDGIYFDIYQDVLYLAIWVSASQQTLINCGALNAGKHKVAVSYTANDINVYLDGALIGSDNSASIPSMSQLNIGTAGSSTTIERYTFNQGLLFKRVLTSQEAIDLTTL